MASSNNIPQFLKYIRRDECLSDEMGPFQIFSSAHNRFSENWILTVRNGYKIKVLYNSNTSTLSVISDLIADFGLMGGEVLVFHYIVGSKFKVYIIGVDRCEIKYPAIMHASQRNDHVQVRSTDGGWKFLKYVSFEKPRFDEIVVPKPFVAEFGARMPSIVKYLINSDTKISCYYDDFKKTLSRFGRVLDILRLSDFTSFDCLILTYDIESNFKLSFFDDRNVEIMLNNVVIESGNLCFSLRYPSHFSLDVMPCHMLQYCYGVDVPTNFFRVSDFWKKKDTITAYDGIRASKLDVRKRKSGKRVTINGGWIEFRNDLNLNVEDRCWFKWIDESYHHFRIEVVRAVIELE